MIRIPVYRNARMTHILYKTSLKQYRIKNGDSLYVLVKSNSYFG